MRKGIVMEIKDDFLTILTSEGQFLQVEKHQNCVLGEEISFTPKKQHPLFHRFLGIKQISAAAAVLLILLGSLIPLYQNDKAYAYMSIDGNSSIEIGVNKKMQVIKLTPYNNDGKQIISHIGTWKKEDIAFITQIILKEMKKQGYLKNNQDIVISTVRIANLEESIDKQLSENMDEIKQIIIMDHLIPIIIKGTEQDLMKAHQLGITAGKYKEAERNIINTKESLPNTNASQKVESNAKNNQDDSTSSLSAQTSSTMSNQNSTPENNITSNDYQSIQQENHVPPGQLKKAEGTPNQQNKELSSKNKAAIREERKYINNGHMKNNENSEGSNHQK